MGGTMRIIIYSILKSLLLIVIITFQACQTDDNVTEPYRSFTRGEISSTTSLGTITSSTIEQHFISTNTDIPFTLTHSVETISINYYTIDRKGNSMLASGAILIPQGVSNLPQVSIQHGTQSKRDLVASVSPFNSSEGMVGLIMASIGYLVVIPDYLGFGVSNILHPYLHAESLIPSVIDLMRAAREYCSDNSISLNGEVFLTGYSEGGYTTFLTQRKIELDHSSEFNLIAAAPMAGPYDLYGTVESLILAGEYSTPAYAAYLFTAYNDLYRWNKLDEIFNEPYASMAPSLFDGSKMWNDVLGQMPATLTELLNPTFMNSINNGGETEIKNAFQENTILDWVPIAPINFIHGSADKIVPIQNSITAMNFMIANGAENVQLTTIDDGTHESAGPHAAILAIQWFETF
jgi:pimeloyl-ACP methyl ester carboxylesterase